MPRHIRGTGRVFCRKGSPFFWIAYYHRGKEERASTGLLAEDWNRPKAEKLLREKTRKVNTSEFTGPAEQRVSFGDLKSWYLDDYREQRRHSIRDAVRIMNTLERTFGGDRAVDITTARMSRYRADRAREGVSETTINRELAAIRRAFSLAITKHKKLTTRPHVPIVSEDGNEREGFLEPADCKRLVALLPADVADVVMFAYRTAWRRGEVLGLEWKDIRFERREGETVAVIKLPKRKSKNKQARNLLVRPGHPLFEVLRCRQAIRRLTCPFVFHREGRPIKDFRRQWRKACATAGLAGSLFHDLRRSGVRNLVRAGVAQPVAMRISGHKTTSVFLRYDITSDTDIASALDAEAAYVAEQEASDGKVTVLAERPEKAAL